MANPADNLDSVVSILEEISRIASKIQSNFISIIAAIKNIKVVSPSGGDGSGAGKKGGASKKAGGGQADTGSAPPESKTIDTTPLENAIAIVSSKIESMSYSIEETSRSIIEFGSLFSQWESQTSSFVDEFSDSVPKLEYFGNEIQNYGKIVEYVSNGMIEYGSLYKHWEEGEFSDGVNKIVEASKDMSKSITKSARGAGGGGGNKPPEALGGGKGGEGKRQSMFAYLDETDHGFAVLSGKTLLAAQGISAVGTAATYAYKGLSTVVTALGSVPGIFMEAINMIGGFVKALDPALMQQLSLALSDLQATAGVALKPLITMAVAVVRAFADNMLPMMQKLEPVIQKVAEKLLNFASIYIVYAMNAFEQMLPVIESLIPVLDDLNEVFAILVPVLIFALDLFARTLNFVIGLFHSFMVGIKMMTIAVLEAAAWIVSWVSKSKSESIKATSGAVQKSMERSLQAQADSFGRAFGPSRRADQGTPGGAAGLAAKNASYAGIGDLGKNMMQAAFGTGTQDTQKRMANGIDKIAEGIGDMVKWMGGAAKENKKLAGVRN